MGINAIRETRVFAAIAPTGNRETEGAVSMLYQTRLKQLRTAPISRSAKAAGAGVS